MEKLTTKQNEIISNLVTEFTKINEAHRPATSSNPLLNIANAYDSVKNKEVIDRASIEARNKGAREDNRERCEDDANDLQCLLNELDKGLFVKVEHSNPHSYIYIQSERWTGPVIKYELPTLSRESYKYLENIDVLGSTIIMFDGYAFHDIIEVMTDNDFKEDFEKLLNK
jgi:hypothetical protein